MRHQLCLGLLAVALLCLGASALAKKSRKPYSPFASSSASDYNNNEQQQQQMTAPAFQPGTEYRFQYNAQIAAGLIAQDEQSQADNQQKAITRIQAQAKITFGSQRHAQLCLRQIRAGQLNEPVKDEQQCQPMSIFEPKQLPEEKQRQLQLCCQFDYADGVIERVQFDSEDPTWSKNIKRGVLNMLQLNLNQNNAQGLRSEAEQQDDEEDQEQQQNNEQMNQQDQLADSFSIPEITVEGACQTTYTVNTASPAQRCGNQNGQPCSFNVTKSINFKQCSKIADVAFGFQTEQQQAQCAQCQMDWFKQQQKQQQEGPHSGSRQQQQQLANGEHPCAKCDPKEVKEQKVDRSTVLRYVLKCGNQQNKNCQGQECEGQQQQNQMQQQKNCPNCCQLERTELLSQYVYKNSKTENGPYGSAMHTVVCAQLQLRSVQPQQQSVPTQSSENDETLMYSNEWETDEKRFYMFGDEEYPDSKSSPFHQVPKASQAEQALRKLVQATKNQEQGIEPQQAVQLQRLVQMLRQCSQQELKQVEKNIQEHGADQQKAKQIYVDALAICGTRNCVKQLAEKIQNQEFSGRKAAFALASLTNLPAPSDTIVQMVEQLCKSQQVQKQPMLKQSCWLTFGALVNELCQHKTQKGAQQSVYGAQSGFSQQEQCPPNKKQQYKQSIMEQFEQAQSTYDKVLALSALGNAGIDSCSPQLEQIIKDKSEQRVVRVKAIDALRRLRTQQPQQIQQILLPIYQNARDQPQVRTAAFAILMYTKPQQSVLDQLVYTIANEPNKQVQAFAYRTMKMLANSRSPVDQQISKHIKNALKLANVDEQQLRNSGKWQIPMFNQQQQEGLFITLASTISARSSLPAYAHAQIDSVLNDQFHINDFKMYMMQQEAEQWYEQAASGFGNYGAGANMRAQRRSDSDYSGGQSLRDIYTSLGIKSRRDSSSSSGSSIDYQQQQNQKPFAMFCMRTGDVDRMFIGLDEEAPEQMPAAIQELLQANKNGQKASLARLLVHFQQQQQRIQATIATNLNEKQATIPTSVGMPLRMTNSLPMLASIEGDVEIEMQQNGQLKAQIKAQPKAAAVHIRKMECWTPFLVTGVESIRSVEMNVPLHAQLEASRQQGLTLKYNLPKDKTQLFGAHSLPFAYCAEVDQQSGLVREPRHVRTIQTPKLERMQHETNMVVGSQNVGIPLHIHAHYHWPATPSSYQEFFQMIMATDNVIHVTYQPSQNSAREAMFRLQAEQFQPTSGQQLQLQDFYADKFEPANSDEDEQDNNYQQTESHSQRRQKLQTFLGTYQPRQQYKHALKLQVQTIGGPKEFKAQCEVAAHCDDKLQACQVKVDAQRSEMNSEQQKWTLKAQAQLVMPETVNSVEEIEQLSQKNNKFACKAECQWGADQKQQINIRIQGEQVQRSAWRQLQQQQPGQQQQQRGQQQQNRLKRRTAFLNKFDMECQYNQLKPSTQNAFGRALELAKSAYFWNSKSQLIQAGQHSGSGSQSSGKVLLSMIIDPVTQMHANITVKTPSQLVRLQQIELPVQARPFPLVRQNAQSIQSIGQYISRQEVQNRAECTVDGKRVDTFDNQDYDQRLSTKCYSVLAKDCSGNDQPQFAVLMKATQNGEKKLKVITPEQTVECQPKSGSSQQIQCKVNGQTVNDNEDSNDDQTVQFNNRQKSDVTVHVSGISVRFNGRKAWLKMSSMYKNQQCGLCGHYDDSADDEWRMGNNQIASDLTQFHRSYALMNDQEECTQNELNNFYQQNGKNIRQRSQMQRRMDIDDEDNDDDDQQQQQMMNGDEDERFNGDFESSEENDQNMDDQEEYNYGQQENNQQNMNGRGRNNNIEPVKRTQVVEQNHEVCFSTQPVKMCPRGTVPSDRTTNNFGSDSSSSQQDDDDNDDEEADNNQQKNSQKKGQQRQQQQQEPKQNVGFVCLQRSSPEARQLLRQYRQGQKVLDVSQRGHSYMEKVRQPQRCRRI